MEPPGLTLLVDESGNTGETLSKDSKFNFEEQPYYVLAGILVSDRQRVAFKLFLEGLIEKYDIQATELKAKRLYDKRPAFITELVDYVTGNNLAVFIELMDKLFYMNIQLVEYFLLPYYSVQFDDDMILFKRSLISNLTQYLNSEVYQRFVDTVKANTPVSLEEFYDFLIHHFTKIGHRAFAKGVVQTRRDYLEHKKNSADEALKTFLPLPDKNPNQRLIHLLPNYNAFTSLVARAQLLCRQKFTIVHDEQKQFGVIFESALALMKTIDADRLVAGTRVSKKGRFTADEAIDLVFVDSKNDVLVQAADLLSGIVMRFWTDFVNKRSQNIDRYIGVIDKLSSAENGSTVGINYVVPDLPFHQLMHALKQRA